MERQTGSTRLSESQPGRENDDDLLRAVKEAAAAQYEILGEIGRGERGSVMYLGRERANRKLVILKLRPDAGSYELSVARDLDSSLVGGARTCPFCNGNLFGGGRFCSHCGKDVSGAHPSEATLAAVQRAAEGQYEVLGEMERSEGIGIVYFARELRSGRIVALRITREMQSDGTETIELGVTQVIKPLVASLGGTYASTGPAAREPAVATARAVPTARSPQPIARSVTPPNVIVPDDVLAVSDAPPREKRSFPVMPATVAAALVVVGGAYFMLSGSSRSEPDASQDPPTSVIVPAAAPAPAPPPAPAPVVTVDSGAISIGSLPKAARVTLNGKVVSDRYLSLLPGRYQLAVSAPGYRAVSQGIDLNSGQRLEWNPVLQSKKKGAPAAKERVAEPTRSAAAPNCFNAYSEKSWDAALVACKREASAGNQSAQRNLGAIYDQGLGTARDPAQAAIWYRKAAETGNRDATFQLATMYENGRGVPQDQRQAIDWYRKAALLGDADSQVKLGRAYIDGKGVAKDAGEASAWFQRAADQGNLYALDKLGAMYLDGIGVRKDEARGARLYQAAAAKGDAQAEFNLAELYAKGRGVQRSDSAANDLFVKAARKGNPDAIKEARRRNLKF
jgi:TPR repeat protein